MRAEFGAERAGLPDTVKSARICPSPGVSISSARQATGSSPKLSGRPRTRPRRRPGEGLGGPGDAAAAAAELPAAPGPRRALGVASADGRAREHRAALAVEV